MFDGLAPNDDDLHTQLEDLIGAVYRAEANWDMDDRIDLGTGFPSGLRRDRTPRS